jgi:hypothetical protein
MNRNVTNQKAKLGSDATAMIASETLQPPRKAAVEVQDKLEALRKSPAEHRRRRY